MKTIVYLYFAIFLPLVSSMFYLLEIFNVASAMLLVISGGCFLKFSKQKLGSINNISFVFLCFLMIYGLSAPISVLLGGGIPPIFSKPYLLLDYLFIYILSLIGISVGMLSVKRKYRTDTNSKVIGSRLLKIGVFFCLLALFFDFINNARIGFASLLLDKAAYQSKIQELSFTLPTAKLYILALIVFCLGVAKSKYHEQKVNVKFFVMFFISFFPTLTLHFVTGQRGFIVTALGTVFLALTYYLEINKVKKKVIVIAVLAYVLLVLLTMVRGVIGYSIENEDMSLVKERLFDTTELVNRLNPAESEFGAPFGNLNEYLLKGQDDIEGGLTYVKSFTIIVPRFMYPGTKPVQAIYDFRDRFFPREKVRGDIASTGYSALLEAYLNFSWVGIFLVYFIIGIFLIKLQNRWLNKAGVYFPIFYLSMFNLTRAFHRSGFDTVIGEFFWAALLGVVTYVCYLSFDLKIKTTRRDMV